MILEIETIASVPHPCGIWRRGTHKKTDGTIIALNTLTSYKPKTPLFQSLCRYEAIVNNQVCMTEEEIFQQYLYRFDELETLLQNSGFTNFKKYPAYDPTQTVDQNTPIIIYECTK